MVYSDEFVAGRRYMKVRLFLVNEKRVGHPDVLDEFGSHRQGLDPRSLGERQPGVCPELPEVKVQRKVLETGRQTRGMTNGYCEHSQEIGPNILCARQKPSVICG